MGRQGEAAYDMVEKKKEKEKKRNLKLQAAVATR